MAMICRTAEGDVLDSLCQHYYGHLNGCVEAVLDANQGLADEPQPFRAGLMVQLPVLFTVTAATVQLWD